MSEERIIQGQGATTQKQKLNLTQHGVRFPSAITEALATATTGNAQSTAKLHSLIIKIDTGASVSLSHPDYLTDIGDSRLQQLPHMRLNGIEGKTEIMSKVGLLKVAKPSGDIISIKCYAFDIAIGTTLTYAC